MKLGPLQFVPKLFPKIWGGESWHLYDRPGDSARVAQGPFQGQTLNALMREFGPGLLGPDEFAKEPSLFPLAFKVIEANEALSVQVHPGDEEAARLEGPGASGKSEMWLLARAEPGARMTAGLRPGTTRERFLEALKAGRLEGVLNEFAVKTGDMIDVPAGRVHAIGKGCRVAELQQNSDTTYRIYDYGRLESGKPRPMHLSQALECINFDDTLDGPPSQGRDLVEGPYFKAKRLSLDGAFRPPAAGPAFHILSCLEGAVLLESEAAPLKLSRGDTVLLPAPLLWGLKSAEGPASLLWGRP
jgi:mannose-6-phosphate isomerase